MGQKSFIMIGMKIIVGIILLLTFNISAAREFIQPVNTTDLWQNDSPAESKSISPERPGVTNDGKEKKLLLNDSEGLQVLPGSFELEQCDVDNSKPLDLTNKNTGLSMETIDLIFQKAAKQLDNSWDSIVQTSKFPRSIERGFRPRQDWTSGFYPGNLWLVYEQIKDAEILRKAKIATELLAEEQYNTRDHDIGFRIYCSYGRGYTLTKKKQYKDVIIQAANSAIQRYNPIIQVIKSWESKASRDWQYPVIIDNMMNLELLFTATALTGDSTYYDIAVTHANMTMKYQYRDDYSCAHVVDYDSITGAFRKMDWNNGYSDPANAAWSRGQSWGLYGFTMTYRETNDKRYLMHAEKIAAFILSHTNMPEDMVPYWDFNSPVIPTIRDASAAAILASALLELSTLSSEHGQRYFEAGEKILLSLASEKYLAEPGSNGNFLLKHATGNFMKNSERDGTLVYADYYFLESLQRYKYLKQKSVGAL